jgi:hypothetical protein
MTFRAASLEEMITKRFYIQYVSSLTYFAVSSLSSKFEMPPNHFYKSRAFYFVVVFSDNIHFCGSSSTFLGRCGSLRLNGIFGPLARTAVVINLFSPNPK